MIPTRAATSLIALLLGSSVTLAALADEEPYTWNPEPEPVRWLERDEDPTGHFWIDIYDPYRDEFNAAVQLGVDAATEGRFVASLAAFEEALSYKPDDVETRLRAGFVANSAQEYERAITHFLRVRELQADADETFGVCFNLASAYAHLERWMETVSEYDRCLAVETRDGARITYYGNVAEVHMAAGDLEAAIEDYQNALSIQPDNILATLGLGVALERAGRRKEARAALRVGFLQDPTLDLMRSDSVYFVPDGEIHYHLGLMLDELGQFPAARARYQSYLDTAHKSLYHDAARERLKELDVADDPLIDSFPTPDSNVSAAAIDTARTHVVLGTTTGRIAMIDLTSQRAVVATESGPGVVDVAFIPSGKEVRVLLEDGRVLRLDPRKDLAERGVVTLADPSRTYDLSADGRFALHRDTDGFVMTNLDKPKRTESFDVGSDALVAAMQPDRQRLVSFPFPKDGLIWSRSAPVPVSIPTLGDIVFNAEFIPSRDLIALATRSGIVLARTNGEIVKFLLPVNEHEAHAISTDPSGRYLLVAHGSLLQLWDLDNVEGLKVNAPEAPKTLE